MDFLRSSGHDGSRERKSWGSLGKIYVLIIFQIFCWSDYSDYGFWEVDIRLPDCMESLSRRPECEELFFLMALLVAVQDQRL